eukprot:3666393-Pleurochrysis_carterae.AAC.1
MDRGGAISANQSELVHSCSVAEGSEGGNLPSEMLCPPRPMSAGPITCASKLATLSYFSAYM